MWLFAGGVFVGCILTLGAAMFGGWLMRRGPREPAVKN